MSNKGKKPAQPKNTKIKNVNLLPSIFASEPNKKMLDSTLDLMTSKGLLLPFKETYGSRSASNRIEEFFNIETDQVRRESQASNMLVIKNVNDEYTGKVSYYDLENYFNIKDLALKDGIVLDKNISVLDLPIDYLKLADYNLYYWLQEDLPACRINIDFEDGNGDPKTELDIATDLIGKPFSTLKDDTTGRELVLQTGMIVYFTGNVESNYKTYKEVSATDLVEGKSYTISELGTTDFTLVGATANDQELSFTATGPGTGSGQAIDEELKTYYVYGVGQSIQLLSTSSLELRSPANALVKRPWDKYGEVFDYPKITWDGSEWDGSEYVLEYPEYVVQEKYHSKTNHWQALDRWHHISTIRSVANFLGINVEDFTNAANKARRPIICFKSQVKLYDWPTGTIREIQSILPGTKNLWQGENNIKDQFGYTLSDDDLVVFESTAGIWQISNSTTSATFSQVAVTVNENDGAIITAQSSGKYYQVVYKNSTWKLAQNKTEKNQTPLFDFYTSDLTNLESLTDSNYQGGVILGFKSGTTYDLVLDKYIEITTSDIELVPENSLGLVNPNQIMFFTDVDSSFKYFDTNGDEQTVKGPYGYNIGNNVSPTVIPFYHPRQGLDITKQVQDILYTVEEDQEFSAEVIPLATGFDTLHIYYDDIDQYKFYYEIQGYGLIRFTSKKGPDTSETLVPLVSGGDMKIVCHDLPETVTFYKTELVDNVLKPVSISSSLITNNGIDNGVITIDLDATTLSTEDTKLFVKFGTSYKIAYVKSLHKWNFLQTAYLRNYTNPLYNGHDYTLTDKTLYTGALSYYKQLNVTNDLIDKIKPYDKISVESLISSPVSRTKPLSLTANPLNSALSSITYYGLYQHAITVKSSSTNIKNYNDPELNSPSFIMGGGTIYKHNDPAAKFAIASTNLPYDPGELIVKQGKHYDSFMGKFRNELQKVIDTNDTSSMTSLSVISMALNYIYLNRTSDLFWSHSNMLGWGEQINNYVQDSYTVTASNYTLDTAISHRTGKEALLHITHDNKILMRGTDYELISDGDEYVAIDFSSSLIGETVVIGQWFTTFNSMIPASLAKIGLAPVYQPEIIEDTSYGPDYYFLVRHDGTRYYLEDGVDADSYPNNLLDQYLYEYEKAVWSSIAYDVENNNHRQTLEDMPGYFRTKPRTWNQSRQSLVNETRQWLLENSIFVMENNSYDSTNGFTLKYQLGTGDGDYVSGSWRAIYKYLYDTDRPHSHPWEMLGYTLKPGWWDSYYSWSNPTKRIALEKALRKGLISNPATNDIVNPAFARIVDLASPEDFPVDTSGNLLPPNELSWLSIDTMPDGTNWEPGDLNPYEYVFLNTQRGLAAEVRARYLNSPIQFVNCNWVPGQVTLNEWNNKLDRTTNFWQQASIEHDYHKKVVDDQLVYTGGLESIFSEFCTLNNKDYESIVIEKFNNVSVNKEFLLNGFTNKPNVRIQSTSIKNRINSLFIPEENYAVRTVKHYPEQEIFYSGMRVIYDGTNYSLNGFTNEYGYFPYFVPKPTSSTIPVVIGEYTFKEKTSYSNQIDFVEYGQLFDNRQDIYDIIVGYGKFLESIGFVFEEPESGELKNWRLSAKQFIFWSNEHLTSGNYIDLNPAADSIKIVGRQGQLENLEGTNENIGQCVDRFYSPLFSKDLLVLRDDNAVTIKTKNPESAIYGIKLTFVKYETVVHLDGTSVFGDVYFNPIENTSKLSFVAGGKKSIDWTGSYLIPGYMFNQNQLMPNLDSMAEVGRNLLDIENVILDSELVNASRSQFGLNRNPELKELFLQEDNEVLFKNAITFNKGTRQVFDSLNPLTHDDQSKTIPYEEYMVRIGEFGNTKNQEYYEFELFAKDLKQDTQIIKFTNDAAADNSVVYINNKSNRWVHKPYNKALTFATHSTSRSLLKKSGLILAGDTDLRIDNLRDLPGLFKNFIDLWSIPSYSADESYKIDQYVRYNGLLYISTETVLPDTWANNQDKFSLTVEPYLPNIFVSNYDRPNPDLINTGNTVFTPGTWQVLQTMDGSIGVEEICAGITDISVARVTTMADHKLSTGDYILIVNAEGTNTSATGIWQVKSLEENSTTQFYIDCRIIEKISTGKIFVFKPVRFRTDADLAAATTAVGYYWQEKYSIDSALSPSGYDLKYPLAIVDNFSTGETFDTGTYKVYQYPDFITPVKQETVTVDLSDIEHLIVYDYVKNKTVAKLELFSPENLYIPKFFNNEIDVVSRIDPAKYNRTTDRFKSIYTSISWYEEYIGRRWWNTTATQFNDYFTGSDQVKSKYWGTASNIALPEIYEWTKSSVHPSKWSKLVENKSMVFGQVASGEAYIDRSLGEENYHWVEEQDYANGSTYTVYYFWVKNKNTIPEESKWARIYSVGQLSKIILNPGAAGLAWWSPINTNTIIVNGLSKYLNNSSTVVQIKKKTKGNEKHQQWLFVSENNTVETIPEWLHVRFRDSITGKIDYDRSASYENYTAGHEYFKSDFVKRNNKFYVCRRHIASAGAGFDSTSTGPWQEIENAVELNDSTFTVNITKNVPDSVNLHRYNRFGNTVRPYVQSWFNDLYEARRTFIKKLNEIMLHVNVDSIDTWPNTTLNNTAVLVGDETVDMTELWYYTDFTSEDFDSTKSISFVTESTADLYTQTSSANDYIRVNNSVSVYTIYRKNADGSFTVVFKKNNAIQFKDILYKNTKSGGWDSSQWDSAAYPWDYDSNSAIKSIVDSLRIEIFLSEYQRYYSVIMCSMFRYVMSEQINVDWLAKSSTIEPVNLIGQNLSNSDYLKKDEITSLVNFYNTVKSYRDKIRGGTINKVTTENVVITISDSIETTDITDAENAAAGSSIFLPVSLFG